MEEENKEQLEKVVVDTLRQLHEWMVQGGEFVKEQAPDIAREILIKGYILNTVTIFASILVMIVLFFLGKFCWRKHKEMNNIYVDWNLGAGVCYILMFAPFLLIIEAIYKIGLIYFTPKLYLLEEISNIIK